MLSGLSKQRSLSSVTPAMLIGNSRLDPLSLGMMGMDNREAVIIDIGAVLTKVGYAGEFVTISEEELYRRLVKFFRELFFKYLLTVAKDRRIVIVESILARTSHRNAVARVLFDAFDAPS
ncbi:unnamed protein product, partial [Brugia pahangi]|uniref:DUF460 domain-containing protein n=1 Tax=Brugia pahangi TaxID=6280 RepID=A0A0N4TBG5_BRUPA